MIECEYEVREIPGTGQIAVRKLAPMPTTWRVFQFESVPRVVEMRQVSARFTLDRERFDELLEQYGGSREALAEAVRERFEAHLLYGLGCDGPRDDDSVSEAL